MATDLGGERGQPGGGDVSRLVAVADAVHLVGDEPTLARAGLRAVLPRQQSSGQRAVREHGQVGRQGERQQLDFGLALDEVVHRLQGDDRRPAVQGAPAEGRRHLPRGEVAHADVEDLARRDQCVERAQRVVDTSAVVEAVQVVEVDAIGAETGQAALDRRPEVGGDAPRRLIPAALGNPALVASTTSSRTEATRRPRIVSAAPSL